MLLCSKTEESFRNKTFDFYPSAIMAVSNIFKQTETKLIASLLNILHRSKSVTFEMRVFFSLTSFVQEAHVIFK